MKIVKVLVRLAKDSFDLCLLASEDAVTFFMVLIQRNTTWRNFERLELFIRLRAVHKIAFGETSVNLRLIFILRRKELLEFVPRLDRPSMLSSHR